MDKITSTMAKNKLLFIILGILLFLTLSFGTYKFFNRTEELLTSTKWVMQMDPEENDNPYKMIAQFSDEQYSLKVENGEANNLSDLTNKNVNVKYGKFNKSISYKLDDVDYKFKIEKKKDNVVMENSHTKEKVTLIPINVYNSSLKNKNLKILDKQFKKISYMLTLLLDETDPDLVKQGNTNLGEMIANNEDFINNNKLKSTKKGKDIYSNLEIMDKTIYSYYLLVDNANYNNSISDKDSNDFSKNLTAYTKNYKHIIKNYYSNKDVGNFEKWLDK